MDQEDSPNPSEKIAARVTSAVHFLTEIQVAVKRTGRTLSPGQAAVTASAPLAATDVPRHQKSKRQQGTNLPSFAYRRTENGPTAQLKQ